MIEKAGIFSAQATIVSYQLLLVFALHKMKCISVGS